MEAALLSRIFKAIWSEALALVLGIGVALYFSISHYDAKIDRKRQAWSIAAAEKAQLAAFEVSKQCKQETTAIQGAADAYYSNYVAAADDAADLRRMLGQLKDRSNPFIQPSNPGISNGAATAGNIHQPDAALVWVAINPDHAEGIARDADKVRLQLIAAQDIIRILEKALSACRANSYGPGAVVSPN